MIADGLYNSVHYAGLILGYVFVAASGWATVGAFVPYLEKLLFDYSGVASLALFMLQIAFINFSQTLGLLSMPNYYTVILAYVSKMMDSRLRLF